MSFLNFDNCSFARTVLEVCDFSLGGSTEPPEPPLDPPQSIIPCVGNILLSSVTDELNYSLESPRAHFFLIPKQKPPKRVTQGNLIYSRFLPRNVLIQFYCKVYIAMCNLWPQLSCGARAQMLTFSLPWKDYTVEPRG